MPVMRGVAMVQVCSINGGATISPKRDRAAASGSVYTGFQSSNAAAQCRIIAWFTGSGAVDGPAVLIGWPTSSARRSPRASLPVDTAAAYRRLSAEADACELVVHGAGARRDRLNALVEPRCLFHAGWLEARTPRDALVPVAPELPLRRHSRLPTQRISEERDADRIAPRAHARRGLARQVVGLQHRR